MIIYIIVFMLLVALLVDTAEKAVVFNFVYNKISNYFAKKERKENLKMKYGFDDSYDKYIA